LYGKKDELSRNPVEGPRELLIRKEIAGSLREFPGERGNGRREDLRYSRGEITGCLQNTVFLMWK
jgi:hypothetical protein